MNDMGTSYIWPAYLEWVAGTTNRKEIAERMSLSVEAARIAPSTVSNWFNGKHRPTNAAHVAALALTYERNVLEAFVAARLLDVETAVKGLSEESVALLARLEGGSEI